MSALPRHAEPLRYEEPVGGVRAVGALLAAAGAVLWLTGWLPAEPPYVRWLVPAVLVALGAAALLLARGHRVRVDPRSGTIEVETPGLFGRASRRIGVATVARVEYVHHDSVESRDLEYGSGSWQVRLRLKDDRTVALTLATSWGRADKRAFGERMARALGVPLSTL
jgi:hypothetical protein